MNSIAPLSSEHLIRFINNNCFILSEVNHSFEKVKFTLRNYQLRVIHEMFDEDKIKLNILIEKTRQIGASWLMAAIFTYIILFIANEQMLVIGKKEEFVDSSELDPNTLMGKIKYIMQSFENKAFKTWVRRAIKFRFLKITNKALGTICNGESSAAISGRGTTLGYVWWDETAFTDHDREIFASISPNSRRLIMLSTANGKNTLFYNTKVRIEEKEISRWWHKIRIHWSEYFDEVWYEKQKQELGNDPVLIAQELDIDYDQSSRERIFYNFGKDVWKDDLVFNRNLRSYTVISFDYGIRDWTTGVVLQYHPHTGEIYITDAVELNNVPFMTVLDMITDPSSNAFEEIFSKIQPKHQESLTRFSINNTNYKYSHCSMTGDPAGNQRGLAGGSSIEDLFFQAGMDYVAYRETTETVLSWIRGRVSKIFINSTLENVRRVINQWSYELDRHGNPTKPVHDDNSHLGMALIYGMNYIAKTYENKIITNNSQEIANPWGY